MMSFLAYPLGLTGLAAIPLLAVIYLLRRRHRRLPVSALFLWEHAHRPRAAGARLRWSRFPPIFLLELAILLCLVLAAADLLLPRRGARRELLVVLDAHVAMQAPGPDGTPALATALQRLRREIRSESWARIRVIEAGGAPVLRVDAPDAATALAQLDGFRARAPRHDPGAALALASRLAGSADAILVLSDRAPPTPPEDERLRWIAVGTPRPNLAIIDALRGEDPQGGELCLIEVANFSDREHPATVRLEQGGRMEPGFAFTLAAGARRRLRLPIPEADAPLILHLEPDDDFMADNRVVLCPVSRGRVSIAVGTDAASPRTALLLKALAAGGRATATTPGSGETAVLRFLDVDGEAPGVIPPWTVALHTPPSPRVMEGPFLRTGWHPVSEELELDGVLWGAQPGYTLPGTPILSLADGTPLLTEAEGPVLHLQWVPAFSTLQRTPGWPVLIDNILAWRSDSLPAGMSRNLALGAVATWDNAAAGPLTVRHPDGTVSRLTPGDTLAVFEPAEPGLYRLEPSAGEPFELAVNLLAPDTSDLQVRGTGEWGTSLSPDARAVTRVSSMWILIMAALVLLGIHDRLIAGGRGL